MKKLSAIFTLLTLLSMNICSFASLPFSQRSDVNKFINMMEKKQNFSKSELTKLFDTVKVNEVIIKSLNHPYEKKPWSDYQSLFITNKRINQGVAFYRAHQKDLAKAEKKYGVPAEVIVAILGVETNYGRQQGRFKVLNTLATIAFNYPRRETFFKKELMHFLLLCREQKINPLSVKGSYAGAMGQPQFMPSSYRHFASNFKGRKKSDLMHNTQDVIASVANYFKQHGWRKNQAVATPISLSGNQYKKVNTDAKKASYSLTRLKKLGIHSNKTLSPKPKKAGLIKLDNRKNSEFWLAYPNFYVITRYNTSKSYATVVHILSKKIKAQSKIVG